MIMVETLTSRDRLPSHRRGCRVEAVTRPANLRRDASTTMRMPRQRRASAMGRTSTRIGERSAD